MIVPIVIDRKNGASMDMWSSFFQHRTLYLSDHILQDVADLLIGQLLFLEKQNSEEPIMLLINSPGGVVTHALGIYDCMNYISCPVSTIVVGQAASAAAVLLTSGTKGRRGAFPSAEVMFHTVSAAYRGKEADIEVSAARTKHLNEKLMRIISKNTGQHIDQVKDDLTNDFFLDAEGALDYGAIDFIVENKRQYQG